MGFKNIFFLICGLYFYYFNSIFQRAEFFLKFIFIYLFLAALGCCSQAFSSCGERGLLFIVVHGLLIVVASLCYRAWALGVWASVVVARGLSSCGTQA